VSRQYRVHEFAQLAGVTVRALHHYDRLGLLRPKRAGSGYRLYGIRDLERLEQIVALKFLGIPLKQIKSILERDARELPEVLRSQRQALEEKRRWLDHAISAIQDAERSVVPGKQADAALLKKIIEVIEMQDSAEFLNQYYSEPAQAKLVERRAQFTPEMQEEVSKAWNELFKDVEASLDEDPANEKSQALAARWRKLIEGFTGGDAEVSVGLRKAWSDREHWPAPLQQQTTPFVNPKVFEFIGKAMNRGKL
jgi:DNA-binding transcriptional MerR regulator